MKVQTIALLAAAGLTASAAVAQDPAPRANPSVVIGGHAVSVEYGRPALGERTLDDMLGQLPADRMWRTGTDQVTTLTTAGDVVIGGQAVPAGKYSVYLHCPAEGAYSLVLNSDLGQPLKVLAKQFNFTPAPELENEPWPHFAYDQEIKDKEVARAPMHETKVASPANLFTIALDAAENGAVMTLTWGDRAWSVDIRPAS